MRVVSEGIRKPLERSTFESASAAMPRAKSRTKAGGAPIVSLVHSEPEWSREEDDCLRELVDADAPITVICSLLKRTANTIRARALVLRLSPRPPR